MTEAIAGLKVLFVAGYGPVTRDVAASSNFYQRVLGLPLKAMEGNEAYLATELDELDGVKHFALWPLAQAAHSCFGVDSWPESIVVPQSWVEFEVEDVGQATAVLKQAGYRMLVDNRMEPWGQTVSRLLSPEGLLVGVTVTPWLR
ncbi:Glyoxalase-like domain [Cedecea lapagei]|uniref:Glyoxalase-like domain n=1 Tax=Cedecea lapagei TaxID=158823 RepID=A0A3S4MEA9_9ENTR|nr:VOC family protein [Cedecea lapagei]VEB96386.1 Glyoxalase-like domain [Cedecea lapagei]